MKVTRLDTGSDGESLFDDTGIPLEDTGDIDSPSRWIPTNGVALRETGSDYDFARHDAPQLSTMSPPASTLMVNGVPGTSPPSGTAPTGAGAPPQAIDPAIGKTSAKLVALR